MPMSKYLSVTGIEDRAQNAPGFDPREAVMYGFVYFTDERRVAYATGQGVVPDAVGQGWPAVSSTHVKLAQDYLDERFPGWNELPTKEEVNQ